MRSVEPNAQFVFTIAPEWADKRLDAYVSAQFPRYSRSYCQKLIKQGRVQLNEKVVTKAGCTISENDKITVTFPPAISSDEVKEIIGDLGTRIVFEHPDFFVIYKPVGLSMHKAHEHDDAVTLVDWLLAHHASLKDVGNADRPGIVHRLDKYTSGLVIIPRTNYAHKIFGELFHDRKIDKTYYAIVHGHPAEAGTIDLPIRAHQSHTRMMADRKQGGKEAVTHYKVVEYYDNAALLEIKLETGRTHQIRVHFSTKGHALLGDVVYGKPSKLINRQALHAGKLSLTYEDELFEIESPLPDDMKEALAQLRAQAVNK